MSSLSLRADALHPFRGVQVLSIQQFAMVMLKSYPFFPDVLSISKQVFSSSDPSGAGLARMESGPTA